MLNEDSRLKSHQRERERPRSTSSKKKRERAASKERKKSSKESRKAKQEGHRHTEDKVSKNSISGFSGLHSSELNTDEIQRKGAEIMAKEMMKRF